MRTFGFHERIARFGPGVLVITFWRSEAASIAAATCCATADCGRCWIAIASTQVDDRTSAKMPIDSYIATVQLAIICALARAESLVDE